jgi:hypothetical protein
MHVCPIAQGDDLGIPDRRRSCRRGRVEGDNVGRPGWRMLVLPRRISRYIRRLL